MSKVLLPVLVSLLICTKVEKFYFALSRFFTIFMGGIWVICDGCGPKLVFTTMSGPILGFYRSFGRCWSSTCCSLEKEETVSMF
jgi:hypothetical protein